MNKQALAGLLFLIFLSAGCTGTKVHFMDAPMDELDLSRGRRVTGRAGGFLLFYLIPLGINDRQENAYMRLKEAAADDWITDIRVTDSFKWIWVGHQHRTTLTAMAYPKKTDSHGLPTQNLTQTLNELETLHKNNLLSDAEYEAARKRAIDK